jgi:hypothetical protein
VTPRCRLGRPTPLGDALANMRRWRGPFLSSPSVTARRDPL